MNPTARAEGRSPSQNALLPTQHSWPNAVLIVMLGVQTNYSENGKELYLKVSLPIVLSSPMSNSKQSDN